MLKFSPDWFKKLYLAQGSNFSVHLHQHPTSPRDPRCDPEQAILDVGCRDGRQRARGGHRQRGSLEPVLRSGVRRCAQAPRNGSAQVTQV